MKTIPSLTRDQQDYLEHAYCHSNCCDSLINNYRCSKCNRCCNSQLEDDLSQIIGNDVILKY